MPAVRVRTLVLLAITAISFYFLLPSLIAVFASWRSLGSLDWRVAPLAFVLEAASYVCLWELERIALHVKAWFPVATSQLSGNALGRVLPGGSATAGAFSVTMLRRAGVDAGNAGAAITAATGLQFATKLALPVLALPAILGGSGVDRSLAVSAYLGLAVAALLIAAGVVAFTTDAPLERVGRAVQWVLNGTVDRHHRVHGLPQRLIASRDFIARTLGAGWRRALVSAVASTLFDFGALLSALWAVGARPQPSLVLIAYGSAALLGLVPFTPGGVGFVEAGLVGTLTLAGVSGADALAATLLYRLVSYWLPLVAGGVAYVLFRRRYDPRGVSATGQRTLG